MTELLLQNKTLKDTPIIDENLDPNFFEFNESINKLKKDKGVEWQPDVNGKKVFDYTDKTGQKWEIVIGKKGKNQYEFRIKKWILFNETNQMDWKTITYKDYVSANNLLEFNRELGAILDETIGTTSSGKRINLVKTGNTVFKDLNNVQKNKSETGRPGDVGVEIQPDVNGKKVFNYVDKSEQKWEIVIGKQNDNQYEFRIKKWIRFEETHEMNRKTVKHNEHIKAKNQLQFNKALGSILDETVGTIDSGKRINLSNTGNYIFEEFNK